MPRKLNLSGEYGLAFSTNPAKNQDREHRRPHPRAIVHVTQPDNRQGDTLMVLPKSISASAGHVFELCPARYVAESLTRTPNVGGSAASLGTSVHNALEDWCLSGHMTDPNAPLSALHEVYEREYDKLFGADLERKDEGVELVKKWYERTHPIEHEIISAEVKSTFPLKVIHQGSEVVVPVTYIWDRCDRLPNGDIDVVDYKTISIPLGPDQMKEKLQVRLYSLAARVQFPDAPRRWVTYDMLRHGSPVGVTFTEEEDVETYRYLQGLLLRILEEDASNPTEKINPECRWCIRKSVCGSLKKHANAGGIHGNSDIKSIAQAREKANNIKAALSALINEYDDALMRHLERKNEIEDVVGGIKLKASARPRRDVSAERVKELISDELWNQYGKFDMRLGDFDKLLKDDRLDDETKLALKGLVTRSFSKAYVTTKPAEFDEDET